MSTRQALLDMITGEDLTWLNRGGAGTTYRYWTSETDYRLLTPAERKELLAMRGEGLIVLEPGWKHHKGIVRLAQPNLLG